MLHFKFVKMNLIYCALLCTYDHVHDRKTRDLTEVIDGKFPITAFRVYICDKEIFSLMQIFNLCKIIDNNKIKSEKRGSKILQEKYHIIYMFHVVGVGKFLHLLWKGSGD